MKKNSPPKKKTSAIGIRVTDDLYGQLEKIEKATGIKPASLGNACLEAAVRYFQVSGELNFPMHIISKSDFESLEFYKSQGI